MAARGAAQRSPANVTAAQRREQVVRLRQARMTFAAIGQQLGITGQRAGQLYKEALAQIPRLAVEEHRSEELELCDLATRQLMKIATDPATEPKVKVAAWAAIKPYRDRVAKLTGVDAPTRHEVTIDAIDAQIAALQAELALND